LRRPLFHLLGKRMGMDAFVRGTPLPGGRIAMFPQAIAADPIGVAGAYLDIPEAEDVVALCKSEGAASSSKPSIRAMSAVVQRLRWLF
jgi:hypothetical protein